MEHLELQEMKIEDYEEVIRLWKRSEGIGLSDADTKENIKKYLYRNIGFSLIAKDREDIVGAILCGHDGRRGFIHHLAVDKKYRNKGIGKKMVEECLLRLRKEEIKKCHLFVFGDNQEGIKFWEKTGWIQRNELNLMSKIIP